MVLYLNHEPVIEIVDLCQNIPLQILRGGFQIEKVSSESTLMAEVFSKFEVALMQKNIILNLFGRITQTHSDQNIQSCQTFRFKTYSMYRLSLARKVQRMHLLL